MSARRGRARDAGAVTVMFAICASMMIGVMCMAIDAIHYEMAQARMQMALDVATLSAAADVSHYGTPMTAADNAQWQRDARAYYDANIPSDYFGLSLPDGAFAASIANNATGGQTIQLSATGSLPLIAHFFLSSAGGGDGGDGGDDGSGGAPPATVTPVVASNQALRLPQSLLELVMVLDNTGSMSDPASGSGFGASKMDGLQQAADNLLNNLFGQGSNTYYVGLVPFASTVNVAGALSPAGSWLNPSFDYNPSGVQMQADARHDGWAGCPVEPRDANGYLYPDAYSPADALKFTPYYYNTPPQGLTVRTWNDGLCRESSRSHSHGGGSGSQPATTVVDGMPLTLGSSGEPNYCGVDAAQQGTGLATDYDETNTTGRTLRQNTDCIGQPVTFLTNDEKTLETAVQNMTPQGSTIIPVGLLWGWRMLSSAWSAHTAGAGNGWLQSANPAVSLPMPETTQGLQRVMIVLTDGLNQIGAAGTIPNDLYFNGLSGVGTNRLAAPGVLRADGTTLANGRTDAAELHGGSVEDPTSGNNAGYPDDVNTFQQAVCDAIKASGVTIYAITFGDSASSSTAQTTMRTCASPGDYYHAPDNATLNTIFQQIASNIGVLRLVK